MVSLLEVLDMRLLRVLTAAMGLAALLPSLSAAQAGKQFKDAWFWGVKGGGVLYSSASTENSMAPLVGAEWLITRTRGGLYVSFDQAFLTTTGSFLDREPDSTFQRNVALKNLRRISIAAMVFPMQSARYHPYPGFGLELDSALPRNVALQILRRFSIAGLVFPMQSARCDPYARFGMGLNQVGSAAAPGAFLNPGRYAIALGSVQSKKTSFTPMLVGG